MTSSSRRSAVFAAALALCACRSAPTRLHTLEPISPGAGSGRSQSETLRVDAVHIPPSWDRVEIMTPSGPAELKIHDLDQWSAPLAKIVRQTLSTDLVLRLPPGNVVYPQLPKASGVTGVEVDILDVTFDSSQASMSVSWVITSGASTRSGQRGEALLHSPLTDAAEPAAVVHAWSVLIGELADRIAADAASLPAP